MLNHLLMPLTNRILSLKRLNALCILCDDICKNVYVRAFKTLELLRTGWWANQLLFNTIFFLLICFFLSNEIFCGRFLVFFF